MILGWVRIPFDRQCFHWSLIKHNSSLQKDFVLIRRLFECIHHWHFYESSDSWCAKKPPCFGFTATKQGTKRWQKNRFHCLNDIPTPRIKLEVESSPQPGFKIQGCKKLFCGSKMFVFIMCLIKNIPVAKNWGGTKKWVIRPRMPPPRVYGPGRKCMSFALTELHFYSGQSSQLTNQLRQVQTTSAIAGKVSKIIKADCCARSFRTNQFSLPW